MYLPKISRLGAIDYEYKYVPNIINIEKRVYGYLDDSEMTIVILSTMKEIQKKIILLHENMHRINNRYLENKLKESQIHNLSVGLYDWILQNKDTVRWIIGYKK